VWLAPARASAATEAALAVARGQCEAAARAWAGVREAAVAQRTRFLRELDRDAYTDARFRASPEDRPSARGWRLRESPEAEAAALLRPTEGDFWQCDHILPVAEGGGVAGWENFRTLCVECHRRATASLHVRLAARRLAARRGVPWEEALRLANEKARAARDQARRRARTRALEAAGRPHGARPLPEVWAASGRQRDAHARDGARVQEDGDDGSGDVVASDGSSSTGVALA
jgi:hypothetical protein